MAEKKITRDIQYLIVHEDGTKRKITVPENWKVTFGPAVKGNNHKDSYGEKRMPMALRFYESETKQRAIFTDVVSFRDLSIEVLEERVEVQEKHGFMECEGSRKATTFQARTKEWVNPDKEEPEKPCLPMPTDEEMFPTR